MEVPDKRESVLNFSVSLFCYTFVTSNKTNHILYEIRHRNSSQCRVEKIKQVAESIGIPREEVENYGRYIAKIPEQLIDEEKVKKSNLVLVTAITATKAGIGKTTVSIGLALGLNKIGKKAIVALREPSLGPCFGMKGGAAGGDMHRCFRWRRSTFILRETFMRLLPRIT